MIVRLSDCVIVNAIPTITQSHNLTPCEVKYKQYAIFQLL